MAEKQRLTDDDVKSKVGDIIDDLTEALKKAGRAALDLMVEKGAESAEDLVDKGVDNLKKKIDEGAVDGQKN